MEFAIIVRNPVRGQKEFEAVRIDRERRGSIATGEISLEVELLSTYYTLEEAVQAIREVEA